MIKVENTGVLRKIWSHQSGASPGRRPFTSARFPAVPAPPFSNPEHPAPVRRRCGSARRSIPSIPRHRQSAHATQAHAAHICPVPEDSSHPLLVMVTRAAQIAYSQCDLDQKKERCRPVGSWMLPFRERTDAFGQRLVFLLPVCGCGGSSQVVGCVYSQSTSRCRSRPFRIGPKLRSVLIGGGHPFRPVVVGLSSRFRPERGVGPDLSCLFMSIEAPLQVDRVLVVPHLLHRLHIDLAG